MKRKKMSLTNEEENESRFIFDRLLGELQANFSFSMSFLLDVF